MHLTIARRRSSHKQGATTCPLPATDMLESTPGASVPSRETGTLGIGIRSLSPSPSPSPSLPAVGGDGGAVSPLPSSTRRRRRENEDSQFLTVTKPTQSACRMTAPTPVLSEPSLLHSVSPLHDTRSSSPAQTPPTWSPQVAGNPYGSDITAGTFGDNEEGEEEVPELEREFAPWDDEDAPDGEQVGVRSTPDSGDAGETLDIGDSCQPRSSMPTWLKNDYLRVREGLVWEVTRNASRKPTCYDRQTFHDGAENCSLAAQLSYDGSAAGIFHQPQYFVWLPHLLVNRIPCPACREAGRSGTKSAVVYIQKLGFVDSPCRVVDIDRNIFIIGYRYRWVRTQGLSPKLPKLEPLDIVSPLRSCLRSVHFSAHIPCWTERSACSLASRIISRVHRFICLFGYGQWVSGDNYKPATESFGILPFDDRTRMRLSMLPYSRSFAHEQKPVTGT